MDIGILNGQDKDYLLENYCKMILTKVSEADIELIKNIGIKGLII